MLEQLDNDENVRTVEAADNGFLVVALSNDNFDMRVCAGEVLQVVLDECPSVVGGRPLFAVLEYELAYLGDEGDVTVRWPRRELGSQQRPHCWSRHGGRAGEEGVGTLRRQGFREGNNGE